jgi:hypothetical protein
MANTKDDKRKNAEKDKKQENYMALGMAFGIVAGAAAMVVLATFGQIVWGGACISIGMILGMVIGMSIPKK